MTKITAQNAYTLAQETAAWIKKRIVDQGGSLPELALILGSGLGGLADIAANPVVMSYEEIPHFPVSTIVGHAGELVCGQLEGTPVLMMKGRFHMYEGYDAWQVTYPIRVMQQLGIQKIIITNAAGGIRTDFQPGELMLIEDHLNLTGTSPLIGPNDERFGARFPDMSEAYSSRLRNIAEETAKQLRLPLQKGVYAGLLGPSYESPAEIRYLRTIGADAVGMSTVLEVIAARHAGMEVLGISCISNMAAGILAQPLSHEEVVETTERVKQSFQQFIRRLVPKV